MNAEQPTPNQIYPPCRANCPVNTDVRAYVSAIGKGDLTESYRYITEKNYFPSVCGRICPHPCEDECRRQDVDEAISIARLKRVVADYINENKLFPGEPVEKTSGKKVAVIGSGPAGLTAAARLAKEGHEVVVFEKQSRPGGMLAYGVPNFRLDFDTLNQDISRIVNLGIKVRANTEIGKDIDFKDLLKDFDAVIISAGLSVSRSLPIPGADNKNILKAISFLRAANSGEPMKIGKKTVVIGGGDVAMDVARVAVRTGAEEVTVCCLECSEEMPAHEWEIEEAIEEGIKIHPAYGPKEIIIEKGKVKAVDFTGCTSVFDDKGAFCPQFNERDKKRVEADTVILAIGQASNLSFLKGSDVEVNERGQLKSDRTTFQTSNPKVFGCGEVAKGPGGAIDAIAHAHKVADSVINYLNGAEPGFKETSYEKLGEVPQKVAELVNKAERQTPVMRPAEERINDYEIFESGLEESQALAEAHRCLSCTAGAEVDSDKCAACLTCVRVCPYEVPEFKENVAYIDTLGCQACGFCAADCPADAIKMNILPSEELNKKISESSTGNDILLITCDLGYKGEKPVLPDKTAHLTVPCSGRLDFINLIKAFEAGVKKIVINCEDENCRHKEGLNYIVRRSSYINEILKNMGLGDEAVSIECKSNKELALKLKDLHGKMLKGAKR